MTYDVMTWLHIFEKFDTGMGNWFLYSKLKTITKMVMAQKMKITLKIKTIVKSRNPHYKDCARPELIQP